MINVRRLFGLFIALWIAVAVLSPAHPSTAQARAGICEGAICGPSGAFTVFSFPTLNTISWDAFPPIAARPHAPQEGGRAISVAPGGDDDNPGTAEAPLATLGRAVETAQPGDLIWVADGDYRIGGADLYEGLILETPGITLAAQNIGGAVLLPSDPYTQIAIAARADDLIVDGFVIRDFPGVGIEFGRVSSPQRNVVLQHLRVEGVEEGIRAAYGSTGDPVIDGLLVYDVWLRDISTIGMQCGEGPCLNMRWEALRVEMPPGDSGNSALDALAVESGENVVVFNADVSGASADGIDLKASRVAVANVIVHDLGRNGIKLWRGGDVINALVHHTGADAAVVFESGADYRVLNTLVARHSPDASAYAMTAAYDYRSEPGRVEIINSVFYRNSGPIWIAPEFDVDVQNTILFGSANGQELVWGDVSAGELDAPISTLEAAGGGVNNPGFIDPGFADPDFGDFAWDVSSPLFEGGTVSAVLLPDFDLYGNPRVIGLSVDLGPWEVRPAP